jgi:nucleoside-diphosphate-sugar epimerase
MSSGILAPRLRVIGVLGTSSLVGRPLLERLVAAGRPVVACSRQASSRAPAVSPPGMVRDNVAWRVPGTAGPPGERITDWIALCPVWVLPELVAWLESLGIERLVAVSSQSAVTKRSSPWGVEREVATRLVAAEHTVAEWAADRRVTLCILRPTMIYDGMNDGNVAAIAAFLERPLLGLRGWFPVCGPARGLRQPVHADDVAAACLAALDHPSPAVTYTISGGEPLSYRTMVERIGQARGRRVRVVPIPQTVWRIAEAVARWAGQAQGLPLGAAARMNEDLSCDHEEAVRDLHFRPRPFQP